jgi:carbamoylphosphate synthase small subunit
VTTALVRRIRRVPTRAITRKIRSRGSTVSPGNAIFGGERSYRMFVPKAIAVRAMDTSGNVSPFSNEIVFVC